MNNHKLPVANILYANLQYAEVPSSEIDNVIKKSYSPFFSAILKRKKTKILLGITGWTIEYMVKKYPKVIKKIQQAIKKDKIQILGGTYSNVVLPIIPKTSQIMQIKTHLDIVQKYFKVKPSGFFLPELAWDPSLSKVLNQLKFSWTIIPHHLIEYSKRPNEKAPIKIFRNIYSGEIGIRILDKPIFYKIFSLYPLFKSFKKEINLNNYQPFAINASTDRITGLINSRSWTAYINLVLAKKGLQSWFGLKQAIKRKIKNCQGLFLPYLADLENIGYEGGNSPLNIPIARFMKFLDILESLNTEYIWPNEFIKSNKPELKTYVKAGSGEPSASLSIWNDEPDNQVLNSLCNQVREKINHQKNAKKREKAWKFLMLAENSDGRGWNPIPEKRIECFKNIEKALDVLG